ncbi:MAG: hypothetical protein U0350_06590 [Caldilineaceae bacterium]
MTTLSTDEQTKQDETWAKPVSALNVTGIPAQAINLNVEGRHLQGPLNGFGQLWQKTYKVRLSGTTVKPTEVIQLWKKAFPTFWPKGNDFYAPLTCIEPGEVAVLNLAAPGGMKLSTGVMVVYADDLSFAFMTPEGHMFASIITFSAYEEGGVTVAQVQPLLRASDPFYELGCRLGVVFRIEDRFWHATLKNLVATFGVRGLVQQSVTCVDPRVQWSEAKNIWHNAAIRSGLYLPVRLVRKLWNR